MQYLPLRNTFAKCPNGNLSVGMPVPTWHGPVVMARYRLDALAAAQEIAAVFERMSDKSRG
jgi:hypothetical protein